MQLIQHCFSLKEEYKESIAPVVHAVVESVALKVVYECLELLSLYLTKGVSPEATVIIRATVVIAPIVEEIFFRGIVLTSIHLIQSLYNKCILKRELKKEEKLREQKIRVHLSAFVFAAIHLQNPHKSISSAFIQFIEAYVVGVSYAYLSEKYHSLSITTLSHGIHNALCLPIQSLNKDDMFQYHINAKNSIFLVALVVYEIGVYLLATTHLDVYLRNHLKGAAEFCAAIPGNIRNHYDVLAKL